jgi:hypothetical protein
MISRTASFCDKTDLPPDILELIQELKIHQAKLETMLDAGACAFLVETDAPDKLVKNIRRVHRSARPAKRRDGL